MKINGKGFLCIYLLFCISSICYSQGSRYDTIVHSITLKVKNITGIDYSIIGLDIDKSLDNPETSDGKIKDPYHTLAHLFLFIARGELGDHVRPKGFIGLYRINSDSIIWRSEYVGHDIDGGPEGIAETDEINNDRKVEIITERGSGSLAQYEQIWIFNWDGKTGKLISQQDEDGTSAIFLKSDPSYSLVDEDGDGIYEIVGGDEDANGNIITVTYSWNGSLYGKWGHSSKYFKRKK